MAESFRLLYAYGAFEGRGERSRQDNSRKKEFGVVFSSSGTHADPSSFVSIVIGRNGIGKSRLLSGVTRVFDNLDRAQDGRAPRDLDVSFLAYECDGRLCKINLDREGITAALLDDAPCPTAAVPMPSKVIALTTTPFDKFPLSRSLPMARMPLSQQRNAQTDQPERYVYLGLRDGMNRASPTAVIFRAIDGLFEASSVAIGRKARIAEVFRFLGYKPSIEVRYDFRTVDSRLVRDIANGIVPKSDSVGSGLRRMPPHLLRMLERHPSLVDELRPLCVQALERARRGIITLRADFESQLADNDPFVPGMQVLRRVGLVGLRAAELERMEDGTVLDLSRASSGELGIVTNFLGLASVIENGSLIFIDEPEISLHPEWQMQYVDLLLKTFGNFTGCHYVLATHSPLILSDVSPQNSALVSLDRGATETGSADYVAGKSPDVLLVTAFRVPGKNNLYLKQEIIKALRLAADGKAASVEFAAVIKQLVDLLPKMEEDSPVCKLIRELQAAGEASAKTQ